MKIIDRYLLRTFLVPLGYCLSAFTLVYIVFDLFNNLSDFISASTPIGDVLRFYLLLIPSALVYIVPVTLLLAVLYCLSQLTKHNELTAMRSCGISLTRLMMPFIVTGLLASVIVLAVNETAGPASAYWTKKFLSEQHAVRKDEDPDQVYVARNLPYRNNEGRRAWYINSFDTRPGQNFAMRHIKVNQFREDGFDEKEIAAESAEWLDGRWWFRNVVIQRFDDYGQPRGAPDIVPEMEMGAFDETPRDFLNEIKDPEYLSAYELLAYIDSHKLSEDGRNRYLTDFHMRLAMPWTCLIVTLIGIPFGHQTGRKGAFRGVLLALSSFFGVYVVINVGTWLGKEGLILPWIAGWAPIAIFLVLAAWLTMRLR